MQYQQGTVQGPQHTPIIISLNALKDAANKKHKQIEEVYNHYQNVVAKLATLNTIINENMNIVISVGSFLEGLQQSLDQDISPESINNIRAEIEGRLSQMKAALGQQRLSLDPGPKPI
jgi:hypothetical protein